MVEFHPYQLNFKSNTSMLFGCFSTKISLLSKTVDIHYAIIALNPGESASAKLVHNDDETHSETSLIAVCKSTEKFFGDVKTDRHSIPLGLEQYNYLWQCWESKKRERKKNAKIMSEKVNEREILLCARRVKFFGEKKEEEDKNRFAKSCMRILCNQILFHKSNFSLFFFSTKRNFTKLWKYCWNKGKEKKKKPYLHKYLKEYIYRWILFKKKLSSLISITHSVYANKNSANILSAISFSL